MVVMKNAFCKKTQIFYDRASRLHEHLGREANLTYTVKKNMGETY